MNTWLERRQARIGEVDACLLEARAQLEERRAQVQELLEAVARYNTRIASATVELERRKKALEAMRSALQKKEKNLARRQSQVGAIASKVTSLEKEKNQFSLDEPFVRQMEARIRTLLGKKQQFTSRIEQSTDFVIKTALMKAAQAVQLEIDAEEQSMAAGPQRTGYSSPPNDWGASLADWSAVH